MPYDTDSKCYLETHRFNEDGDRAVFHQLLDGDWSGEFYYAIYLGNSETIAMEGSHADRDEARQRAIRCYQEAVQFCERNPIYAVIQRGKRLHQLHTHDLVTAIITATALGGDVVVKAMDDALYWLDDPETADKTVSEVAAVARRRMMKEQLVMLQTEYEIGDAALLHGYA